MIRQVLHTVWCNIAGEAAGEIWNWPVLEVKTCNATETSLFLSKRASAASRSSDIIGKERDQSAFLELPDVIILKIFRCLGTRDRERASAACKQWRRINLDPSLWRSFDLSDCTISSHVTMRDKTLIRLVSRLRSSALLRIDMSGPCCRHVTNVSLFHVARNCTNIQALNISGCKRITDTGIELIAQNCVYLEVLVLARCNRITNRGLGMVLRRSGLRHLDVSGCAWVGNDTLLNIARRCRALRSLELEGCAKITDRGLNALAVSSLELTRLNLRNIKRITDNGMERLIAAKKHELRALEIGIVRKSCVTVAVLGLIAEHCTHLESLDFQMCRPGHVDELIGQVAEQCHGLRHLAVRPRCHELSAATLARLSKACPHLQSVERTMRYYKAWNALPALLGVTWKTFTWRKSKTSNLMSFLTSVTHAPPPPPPPALQQFVSTKCHYLVSGKDYLRAFTQEWSISNFPCSLTRNITSHCMKNLAFHSSLRW